MSDNVFMEAKKCFPVMYNKTLCCFSESDEYEMCIVYGNDFVTDVIYLDSLYDLEEMFIEYPNPKDFLEYLFNDYECDAMETFIKAVKEKGGLNFFGDYVNVKL